MSKKEVKLYPINEPIETKIKSKQEGKKPINQNPDLFSDANKPNSESEVESKLTDEKEIKTRLYNANELNKLKKIKLIKLAQELNIKIPKGAKYKRDIIENILLNQE